MTDLSGEAAAGPVWDAELSGAAGMGEEAAPLLRSDALPLGGRAGLGEEPAERDGEMECGEAAAGPVGESAGQRRLRLYEAERAKNKADLMRVLGLSGALNTANKLRADKVKKRQEIKEARRQAKEDRRQELKDARELNDMAAKEPNDERRGQRLDPDDLESFPSFKPPKANKQLLPTLLKYDLSKPSRAEENAGYWHTQPDLGRIRFAGSDIRSMDSHTAAAWLPITVGYGLLSGTRDGLLNIHQHILSDGPQSHIANLLAFKADKAEEHKVGAGKVDEIAVSESGLVAIKWNNRRFRIMKISTQGANTVYNGTGFSTGLQLLSSHRDEFVSYCDNKLCVTDTRAHGVSLSFPVHHFPYMGTGIMVAESPYLFQALREEQVAGAPSGLIKVWDLRFVRAEVADQNRPSIWGVAAQQFPRPVTSLDLANGNRLLAKTGRDGTVQGYEWTGSQLEPIFSRRFHSSSFSTTVPCWVGTHINPKMAWAIGARHGYEETGLLLSQGSHFSPQIRNGNIIPNEDLRPCPYPIKLSLAHPTRALLAGLPDYGPIQVYSA